MVDVSVVNGIYKPTNITGKAPPCTTARTLTELDQGRTKRVKITGMEQ